uniref:Uncharacterized protein n=1 Tax=Candidatus Kentrum sp. SD TaxID=2126332 RepID=A0A451BR02_9GAMM|nr:MAG: hypothetical protein BECKSD772D_GA0070982_11464 [Candidatus Kentron sp. SD]
MTEVVQLKNYVERGTSDMKLKFLLDAQLPRRIADWLRTRVRHDSCAGYAVGQCHIGQRLAEASPQTDKA